jgi:hypothetical protein
MATQGRADRRRGKKLPKPRRRKRMKAAKRFSSLAHKRHLSSLEIGPVSLQDLAATVHSQGFVVHPTTSRVVKRHLVRAVQAGTIAGEKEIRLSAMALMAGAMETAAQAGRRQLRAADVEEGWRDHIMMINHPPQRCLRRSVVERVGELRESLPAFQRMQDIAMQDHVGETSAAARATSAAPALAAD